MADREFNNINGIKVCDQTARDSIPTKTSQLTNDSGYITNIPDEYITETELNAKGYATTSQIPTVPTNVSEFTNDANYASETFVSNKIAEAQLGGGEVDLSGYVTKETGNANQITFADGQTFQAKLDAGTLKGDKGDTGEQGPQGPQGEVGPQGPQGPAGSTEANGVSIIDAGNNFTATDVEGALAELFQLVSNGKTNLETAITDMGGTVSKAGDVATFDELVAAIATLTSSTPSEVAPLLSSALCFYEPSDVPNTWATDSTGKILDVDTEAFYDLFYNPYVGTVSGYGTVTKTQLGLDESGTYPLYEYDFCPANYNRTILLTSGMHPYELSAHFGCAWMIKSMMENYNDNAMLKYLHDNVRIKIIPIVNPWGWNQSPKKYGNINGVNPNRNFDYTDDNGNSVWEKFPTYTPQQNEWNVKGDAPFSEAEVRIMRDWALANKDVAEFWIDCHTGGDMGSLDNFICYNSHSILVSRITNALTRLEYRIKEKYSVSTTTKELRIDHEGSIRLVWGERVAGIPGMTVEQSSGNTKWGTAINNESGDIANYCTTLLAYISEFLVTEYDSTVEPVVTDSLTIDLGGIDYQSPGEDTGGTNRLRTREYIDITDATSLQVTINSSTIISYLVRYYDESFNFIGASRGGWLSSGASDVPTSGSKYCRLVFKNSSDIDIKTDTISNVVINDTTYNIAYGTYTPDNTGRRTITKNFIQVSIDNTAISIDKGSSYAATLTTSDGYELNSIVITMGGTDITNVAYNSETNIISIDNVTGDIVITAIACRAANDKLYLQVGAIEAQYPGGDTESSTRARTIDYLPCTIDATITVDLSGSQFTQYVARWYNDKCEFVGNSGGWKDSGASFTPQGSYYRLVFRVSASDETVTTDMLTGAIILNGTTYILVS